MERPPSKEGHGTKFQEFFPTMNSGAHISLVFREMWDSTELKLDVFYLLLKPRHLDSQAGDSDSWNPTSREKRARYGHPSSW
jgi:hypothetical protein